jgi:hypothetical protein
MDQSGYRATSGEKQGIGATPGEALSALLMQLSGEPELPITIWPFNRQDSFFSKEQQNRIKELKSRRNSLSDTEYSELENLIAASFEASAARARSQKQIKQ